MKNEFEEALAYAKDPSTDRGFLAMKFTQMLLEKVDPYISVSLAQNLVQKGFAMADEFLSHMNDKPEEL